MTKTILKTEKWVECVETEKHMLSKTNEEVLQPLVLTRNHPSGGNKTLLEIVPNDFIDFVIKVEDGIHRWRSKEVSELGQYVEGKEQNWTDSGETVLNLGWSD